MKDHLSMLNLNPLSSSHFLYFKDVLTSSFTIKIFFNMIINSKLLLIISCKICFILNI
jgi:hypothetical protein